MISNIVLPATVVRDGADEKRVELVIVANGIVCLSYYNIMRGGYGRVSLSHALNSDAITLASAVLNFSQHRLQKVA